MKYFIIFLMVSILGCSTSNGGSTNNVGNAGNTCYPNNTCNQGLICEDGICMEQDLTGTAGHPCYGNGTCNEGLVCEDEICITEPFCGNNTIEGNEECDGTIVDSCLDLGYYAGTTTCNSDCTLNVSGCAGTCGDGIIDTGEQCDGTTNDSLVPVRFTMTTEPIDEIEFRFEDGWRKTCVHVIGTPVSEWVCTR